MVLHQCFVFSINNLESIGDNSFVRFEMLGDNWAFRVDLWG
jgi:hypothetical protein